MATSRSRVRVEVENLDAVLKRLDGNFLLGNPLEDMYKELGAVERKALQQKTRQLAFKTGNLAGSYQPFQLWKHSGIPSGGSITNPTLYGRFVDQGTVHIKPRRFLRKTATEGRGNAEAALRKVARKVESKWPI